MKPKGKHAGEEIRKLIDYLEENADRVDYGSLRRGGYPIGSGGIESGNKAITHFATPKWASRGFAFSQKLDATDNSCSQDRYNAAMGRVLVGLKLGESQCVIDLVGPYSHSW